MIGINGSELTSRRRWTAVLAATLVMQFSYWLTVSAVTSSVTHGPGSAGPLALALALAPVVFLTLAFGSGHPHAPMAALKAMGLFLVVGLSIGLADVVVGMVAGFGAGGVVTLRTAGTGASPRGRWLAVATAAVYVLALLILFPAFGVLSGAVVPLSAVAIVDQLVEDRQAAAHPVS